MDEMSGKSVDDNDAGILKRIVRVTFLILIFSLGFIQIPFEVTGKAIVITDIVFLVLAAVWFLSLLAGQLTFRWISFYWLLAFYFIALVVSSTLSENRQLSFSRVPAEAYLIALCVLAYNIVDNETLLRQTVRAWIAGTAFAVAIGLLTIVVYYTLPGNELLEYTTYHFGAVPVGNYPRITSTFVSASMFCNYLNVSLVIALVAIAKKWISPTVGWTLIAAVLICSIFTISVGLGGVVLACGVWYSLFAGEKRTSTTKVAMAGSIIIAVCFVAISFFALQPYPEAPFSWQIPGTGKTLLPSSRFLVWSEALRTFIQNPFFGSGLGLPVANVVFTNTDGGKSLLTDAHNTFLSVAAQNGLFGSIAIILIVAYVMQKWLRGVADKNKRIVPFALGLAFFCSFVYQGLTGSFEEARHLWVLLGVFLSAESLEPKEN